MTKYPHTEKKKKIFNKYSIKKKLKNYHKKNGLNSISSWRRCLGRGMFMLFACFLFGQSANAQNFRTLRDVKVNETELKAIIYQYMYRMVKNKL